METKNTGRFSGTALFLQNKPAQKKENLSSFCRQGEKSGASLYGNIATGGVINIISRKAISPLSNTKFTLIHPITRHFHKGLTGQPGHYTDPERPRTFHRTSVQPTPSAEPGFTCVTRFYSIQPPRPIPPEKDI